jgi:hypothetical protein
MSDPDPEHSPAEHRPPLHTVINYWGVAILLVGLAGAALIYVFGPDDGDTDLAGEITRGRMYRHNLELMGGKFAVYADQFYEWFAGLWHGRSLAYTVAVLAVAIALVCFWLARVMSSPLPSERDQRRES